MPKKKKPKKTEYMPKYWICADCATAKGWELPKNYMGTVSAGACEYCKTGEITTMIPYVDFRRNGIEPIWD